MFQIPSRSGIKLSDTAVPLFWYFYFYIKIQNVTEMQVQN